MEIASDKRELFSLYTKYIYFAGESGIWTFEDTMVMEKQELDMELASERIPVPRIQQPKLNVVKRNKSSVLCGKPRLRKKALHDAILKQMEFYFSDANLSKDRYLSERLEKNSCNIILISLIIQF